MKKRKFHKIAKGVKEFLEEKGTDYFNTVVKQKDHYDFYKQIYINAVPA